MAETREDLIARWWDGWWAEDFSWAGLARKRIGRHGGLHGERTLQEYWRRDPATDAMRDDAALEAAGELVRAPDGALWHVAHVPLAWRDGVAAKASWDDRSIAGFGWVVEGRVAAATSTEVDGMCAATGPDGRAQLAGAVLLTAPAPPAGEAAALHLHCDRAWLPEWPGGLLLFGAGFRCRNGIFSEGASFHSATLSGNASFDRAIFSDDASFGSATFSDNASFAGATFSGDASFDSATFLGNARFARATFSGHVGFESATFSGKARFSRATFSGYAAFESATFSGDAGFDGATFSGYAAFDSATFSGDAHFRTATFSGETGFAGATFSENVRFDIATFSGDASFYTAAFSGDSRFDRATFSGNASFDRATFSGNASFAQSEFSKSATFADGSFGSDKTVETTGGAARFHRCTFAGPVSFTGRQFHQRMDFSATTFVRQAWFAGITWPRAAADWHAAFDQAVFRDVASFRDSGFRCFAAFDGASFGGGLQLDDTDETAANTQFRKELAASKAPAAEREQRLKELERGCRVLKQAMEKASHKAREQILHAFELIARRSQRDTPWWEKLFSLLYAWTSDYGRSIARPLSWLLLGIPAFAFAYWLIIGAQPDRSEPALFRECLAFSLERLIPLSTAAPEPGSVRALLFGDGRSWANLGGRVLAAVQSLLSLALAFLAGLAIRRRFQIS